MLNDEDIEEVLGLANAQCVTVDKCPTDQLNAAIDLRPILPGDANREYGGQSHVMINGRRHIRRPGHHLVVISLLAMQWEPNR